MNITRASCDSRSAGKEDRIEIENPVWEDIEAMIRSLDGESRTLVTFGNEEEGCYMAVGGGNGKYIAYISYDDGDQIHNLIQPDTHTEGWVELIVGGQRGRFPANTCVSQEMVQLAARCFFDTQEAVPSLHWAE